MAVSAAIVHAKSGTGYTPIVREAVNLAQELWDEIEHQIPRPKDPEPDPRDFG